MSRMLTLFVLSVLQLVSSRRLWAMLVLAAVPVLVAGIYRFAGGHASATDFSDGLTNHLIISTVLPLVMLVMATASFGNEVDDRTLSYLVLKPIPRWWIAVPKLLAPLLVGGALVAGGGAIASLLVVGGDPGHAAVTVAAVFVGAAAYAALFAWAGLVTGHALAFGVVYVFVWEASLTSLLSGIRFLSVRQYALAVVRGLDGDRLRDAGVSLDLSGGLIGAGAVIALFLALTVYRLRRMDVP